MEKEKIIQKQQELIQLTKKFCDEKLNAEYAALARKLIQKLGRKRDVPFATGQAVVWAAAIIHALGSINFLFDKSFEPYLSVDDINSFFGTKKTTIGNKSREIKNLLNIGYWDNEFSTRHMKNSNPFADLVMFDDFITPVSSFPEEVQELVQQKKKDF
jgi:hypothetical protein